MKRLYQQVPPFDFCKEFTVLIWEHLLFYRGIVFQDFDSYDQGLPVTIPQKIDSSQISGLNISFCVKFYGGSKSNDDS